MKTETKGKIKGAVAGFLAAVTLVGGGVFAAQRSEMIEVFYDDISIVVDGQKIDPKDASGNAVQPFIYNGTTYLPVRAVGNAIGKEVAWDGVEKVVYLGTKPGDADNWLDECPAYQTTYYVTKYTLEENKYFTMSGNKYSNGYYFDLHDSINRWGNNYTGEALFNLNGKYETFSCTVGHIDGDKAKDAKLNIYLDGIIAYTADLGYDELARKITIPLNGALQMKIQITSNADYGISEGKFS